MNSLHPRVVLALVSVVLFAGFLVRLHIHRLARDEAARRARFEELDEMAKELDRQTDALISGGGNANDDRRVSAVTDQLKDDEAHPEKVRVRFNEQQPDYERPVDIFLAAVAALATVGFMISGRRQSA